MSEQITPGKLVSNVVPWKIFRQDAGMGEHDYAVFLNGVFFCQTDHETTAREIIKAVSRKPNRAMDRALNEGDGVYRP